MNLSTITRERTSTDVSKEASVLTRYSDMQPDQFQKEIDQTWKALDEIRNVVSKNVASGHLRPIDGVKAISCVAGSTLGYEEFHPRGGGLSPDMASALYQQALNVSAQAR